MAMPKGHVVEKETASHAVLEAFTRTADALNVALLIDRLPGDFTLWAIRAAVKKHHRLGKIERVAEGWYRLTRGQPGVGEVVGSTEWAAAASGKITTEIATLKGRTVWTIAGFLSAEQAIEHVRRLGAKHRWFVVTWAVAGTLAATRRVDGGDEWCGRGARERDANGRWQKGK